MVVLTFSLGRREGNPVRSGGKAGIQGAPGARLRAGRPRREAQDAAYPTRGSVGRAPATGSVNFSLLAEIRETAVAELQARRGGFIHRAVDRLAARATVRCGRGGGGSLDAGGTGRTGAFRFQGPEMSERHAVRLLASWR